MAIDTENQITAVFYCKWITVRKLEELLRDLDQELELHPNGVGNLSIVEKSSGRAQIGYIDFNEEKTIMLETKK